ncbi:YqhV family protein [Ureibacillus sp. GCM10028918]|uniref:YqhV family protein n=1 Tax=Ureibacillus sp. GCM10028918 TaxID=3273429 RepID=UPI003608FFB2
MVYVASALLYMVLLRLVSGSIEITIAGLMYKSHDLEKALTLNSMLALVGPCILIITTGLGVAGLGDKISFQKMFCLFGGILLILLSLKMK